MTNGINGITNGIEYENGIEYPGNIETILGVPVKSLPGNACNSFSPLIEGIEEIYSERLPYLINTDDLLEEILR